MLEQIQSDARFYFRSIIVLLIVFALVPIPIYIYVLEIHSSNLAQIEQRLAKIETLLHDVLPK